MFLLQLGEDDQQRVPGEVVRLVLVKLTEDKLLFGGQTSEALLTPGRFETRFISEIEE